MKYPVSYTPDWSLYVEHHWFGTLLHCDILRWGRHVQRRLRSELLTILDHYPHRPVYGFTPSGEDAKHVRFMKLMGGVYHHTRYNEEGKPFDFYRFLPLN